MTIITLDVARYIVPRKNLCQTIIPQRAAFNPYCLQSEGHILRLGCQYVSSCPPVSRPHSLSTSLYPLAEVFFSYVDSQFIFPRVMFSL